MRCQRTAWEALFWVLKLPQKFLFSGKKNLRWKSRLFVIRVFKDLLNSNRLFTILFQVAVVHPKGHLNNFELHQTPFSWILMLSHLVTVVGSDKNKFSTVGSSEDPIWRDDWSSTVMGVHFSLNGYHPWERMRFSLYAINNTSTKKALFKNFSLTVIFWSKTDLTLVKRLARRIFRLLIQVQPYQGLQPHK